jgi:4,5-DOPA dioxygenase extradiol
MKNSKMPVLFVGHGSPMNAIEDTSFSREWKKLGEELPKPNAILAISAHWLSDGTRLCGEEKPKQIYDMYGFPEKLYAVRYRPQGCLSLAKEAADFLGGGAKITKDWGIDHGAWAVLTWMYPEANIPVVEMSIDENLTLKEHYLLAEKLAPLREKGVLLLASGNVVHNLSLVSWGMNEGYPWADEFDGWVKTRVLTRDDASVIDYHKAGLSSQKAFYTQEHFVPLLYALGASQGASAEVFNDKRTLGAMSMTGYLFR